MTTHCGVDDRRAGSGGDGLDNMPSVGECMANVFRLQAGTRSRDDCHRKFNRHPTWHIQ